MLKHYRHVYCGILIGGRVMSRSWQSVSRLSLVLLQDFVSS
jgi:hypothetical protein